MRSIVATHVRLGNRQTLDDLMEKEDVMPINDVNGAPLGTKLRTLIQLRLLSNWTRWPVRAKVSEARRRRGFGLRFQARHALSCFSS